MADYTLIDTPLTPYSTREDIQQWISDLALMNETKQVRAELRQARDMLAELDQSSVS